MDGIIIVKKEKGYTSHDVVAKVKKITKTKVGHTGTLDPMATGVLPLLLGDGTKLSKYLIDHDKVYETIIQLGQKTDTADTEGKVIEEREVDKSLLDKNNIEKIFNNLIGKQKQKPPIYSAIKIEGKKLYEYARKHEEVEIPEREIEIYSIELLEYSVDEKTITFRVHCSKGTYIRSLCETIAEELETVGYMKELNRIQVGKFSLEQAVTINEIENSDDKFWKENLITIEEFFKDRPTIILEEYKLNLLLNGVKLKRKEEDGIYVIKDKEKNFVGIATIQNGLLKRDIIVD